MKALTAPVVGGPETLVLAERPAPKPGPGEALVRVKAAALNRADLLQRRGHYPPPAGVTDILGLECAGVVESSGGPRFKAGDRVMALMAGGGQAEVAAIHEGLLMPVPDNLSFTQAAAIPEVFLTAYNALARLGRLAAGQSVFVHAGGSGVGTAAIQIVKQLGGKVFVTAGSEAKADACRKWGADGVVLRGREDFAEKTLAWTGGRGVDVLLDMVGAPAAGKNAAVLAEDGRWIVLGFMGGPRPRDFDFGQVLFKRLSILGTTLRARPTADKIDLVRDFSAWALPRFADGRLSPVVDRVFPWTEADAAHRRMEANENVGKIVLSLP